MCGIHFKDSIFSCRDTIKEYIGSRKYLRMEKNYDLRKSKLIHLIYNSKF